MADVDLEALENKVEVANGTTDYVAASCRVRRQAEIVDAVPALIAELRRLRGQTCETCRYTIPSHADPHVILCRQWRNADGWWPCITDIGGCRAHEPKVQP